MHITSVAKDKSPRRVAERSSASNAVKSDCECASSNPGGGNLTKCGFFERLMTAKLPEVGHNLAGGTHLSNIQTLLNKMGAMG